VWEIRVVVGFDASQGHSAQRSFTVRGDAEYAEQRRRELVELWGVTRVDVTSEGAWMTVSDLLDRYVRGPHLWKPATVISHSSVVRSVRADPIAGRRLVTLTAGDVRGAICRWQETGVSVPTVSGRWLVVRSAMSWAVAEGILQSNPLTGMRGPPRPRPRLHHSFPEVRQILRTAECDVEIAAVALAGEPRSSVRLRTLFSAEQALLLVRLAADSGARRGELAALRLGDLDGRVLTIERAVSHGVLGSTKSSRSRRLTLGATTVALIHDHFGSWVERGPVAEGDWLFAPTPSRETYMTADALTHKFRRLGRSAGVENPALHRLRHAVATHLVDEDKCRFRPPTPLVAWNRWWPVVF
jgi:integrase